MRKFNKGLVLGAVTLGVMATSGIASANTFLHVRIGSLSIGIGDRGYYRPAPVIVDDCAPVYVRDRDYRFRDRDDRFRNDDRGRDWNRGRRH